MHLARMFCQCPPGYFLAIAGLRRFAEITQHRSAR